MRRSDNDEREHVMVREDNRAWAQKWDFSIYSEE